MMTEKVTTAHCTTARTPQGKELGVVYFLPPHIGVQVMLLDGRHVFSHGPTFIPLGKVKRKLEHWQEITVNGGKYNGYAGYYRVIGVLDPTIHADLVLH